MVKLLLKGKAKDLGRLILPVHKQIKSWRKANRKMGWGIPKDEFDGIEAPPQLTKKDQSEGLIGMILSYGFGGDGCGPEGIQFLTVTHTHFPDMMNEKKSLSWHL